MDDETSEAGDRLVARLVADPWAAAPPQPPGTSLERRLLAAVAAVAAALDSQGPLAPDCLNTSDLVVVGDAFGRLVADRVALAQHAAAGGRCPVDGEQAPCAAVRRLAQRYAVNPEV